jgi:hypothetical protein
MLAGEIEGGHPTRRNGLSDGSDLAILNKHPARSERLARNGVDGSAGEEKALSESARS